MSTKNLLVELLVEELPPKALKKLGEAFAQTLFDQLKAQGLTAPDSVVAAYATPRRLAAHITNVAGHAASRSVSQKLMPVSVGLDASGAPTPALLKKLQSLGADASAVAGLKRAIDGKAEALFHESEVAGASIAQGLQKALDESVARLPIPKVMTYQLADGWSNVKFVRPAHRLATLHGSTVLGVQALGLQGGNMTEGHRFECDPPAFAIEHADRYEQQLLEQGRVVASFEKRRAEISRQLAAKALDVGGGAMPIDDDALLDEVTALVERPNVLVCEFEREFLDVPQECLVLTMKANQKYFPLLDAAGKLTNKFLVVSNITPADPSAVIQGNERVVRPRLADAKFFFDQDRKKTLESRLPQLAKVVYHNKLGTQADRSERVRKIARELAVALKMSDGQIGEVEQAARLAKADLVTDMVGEFPELQGTMGRYYALHEGLAPAVADAIEDHYKPRFAGDTLPRGDVGVVVALADKLETLVGMFGIGQLPTGDKDPFALRRHAIGVARLVIEKKLSLGLTASLVASASLAFTPPPSEQAKQALYGFMHERLAGILRDDGYSPQEVEAVMAKSPERIDLVPGQLAAVKVFASLPEAPSLAAANKRVANILKKSEAVVEAKVDEALLVEPAEKELKRAIDQIAPEAQKHWALGQYTENLQSLAALKAPVDAFFEHVMVNADDPKLRANRLGLLAMLHTEMNRVADLSKLAA